MPPAFPLPLLFSRDEHDAKPDTSKTGSGVSGWTIFLIVILVLAALGALGLVFYRSFIHRGGASSSSGAASNPINSARSWISRATYKMRNPRARSASAGFEGISAGRARQRGLDNDEAWDARVDQHDHDPVDYVGGGGGRGYYEETELRDSHRYQGVGPHDNETSYTGARPLPVENPFADEHALGGGNLRSVSPRPVVDTDVAAAKSGDGHGSAGGEGKMSSASPTRRSLFREDV